MLSAASLRCVVTRRAARFSAALLLPLGLTACPPAPGKTCFVGQLVTVPSTDTTAPGIVADFVPPAGPTVSLTTASPAAARNIVVSPGGRVTLVAKASDPEGVKDIQIWVGTRTCLTTGGVPRCSGPGLLGGPEASNPDPVSPGGQACTERVATINLDAIHTAVRSVSHEISIRGINTAGQQTEIASITLGAS